MSTWHDVSHREPCRICDKPDWCRFSADGTWALCRRLDTGAGIHKVGQDRSRLLALPPGRPSPSRQPIIELSSQPYRECIERADPPRWTVYTVPS